MDYTEQQAYLRRSRIRGLKAVFLFLVAAAACAWLSQVSNARWWSVYALVSLAVAGSLYYTPDYLHLTVVPGKAARWQARIRWRIVAAVVILGMFAAETSSGRILVAFAAMWLALANVLLGKLIALRYQAVCFCFLDLVLLASLILSRSLPLLIGAVLLAAALHLAQASIPPGQFPAVRFAIAALIALMLVGRMHTEQQNFAVACCALILIAPMVTLWTVGQARRQNAGNITAALAELVAFTGYTPERIGELWETSNQQLAKNWEEADIPHDERERMAEWYRQNSELYLFAISAYNLEYKRIKSNLKVIAFARGSCLDYGAGNGEIVLELARRGHPVTYFDVEGVTMRFARSRAEQQRLAINFARTKDDLRAAAQPRGFDTIFSFDVLEHLPDLPGELAFLSSLLRPGGIFVFDVPSGSTKAHPMHLNHRLNVLAYLKARGLKDRRGVYLRMPFRKEEKWVFEA